MKTKEIIHAGKMHTENKFAALCKSPGNEHEKKVRIAEYLEWCAQVGEAPINRDRMMDLLDILEERIAARREGNV